MRVITFAKRPRVVPMADDAKEAPALERHDLPTDAAAADRRTRAKRTGLGAATDLASAMQLAYGLYPSGYLRRAVILSDGVQTDGDILAEANRARDFGVKIFTIPYHRPVPGEVALRDLRVPDKVRVGEPFNLHANIFSSRPQKVQRDAQAGRGHQRPRRHPHARPQGRATTTSRSRASCASPGEVTYALDLTDIPEDRFKENNRFAVSVAVPGRPDRALRRGQPGARELLSRPRSRRRSSTSTSAARARSRRSIRELERYDFVILSDAPAEAVSLTQQDAIESYVRDLGGGFLFAGGEAGYGLGGWYHTTIERILPVRMDAEKRRDEPQVAMVARASTAPAR